MYRVEKYLDNNFQDYEDDSLELSQGRLEISVNQNELVKGQVIVRSRKQREVHCFFYSSHYRMQCMVGELTGKEGALLYQFDTTGLDAGETVKGEISILSNVGEYHIPFTVEVLQPFASTSLGPIRNLFHFTNLSRTAWKEAVELFYSKEFALTFSGHDRQYYSLYRGLSANKGNEHNVDEFLIAIHKKQAASYTLKEETLLLKEIEKYENVTLNLEQNGWGYTHIETEVIGSFIENYKQILTEEDFMDGKCQYTFVIDRDKLRDGNNIGQIIFHYSKEQAACQLIVQMPVLIEKKFAARKEQNKLLLQLMREYMEYVTGSARPQECLKDAEKIVEKMNSQYGRNINGRLYQSHILLELERENEARWILGHVENVMQNEEVTNTQYAYYLFLKARMEHDDFYSIRVTDELRQLMPASPKEFLIVCFYLRMAGREEVGPVKRLAMFEEQYLMGANSPILYREAWRVLEESMAYLTKLGEFEIALLRFAMRYGLFTKEAADQVNYLVLRKKECSHTLFRMMILSYHIFPEDETVQALCTLLIRTGCTRKDVFEWYKAAVERQLRITSLYEYYLMSVDMEKLDLPPLMVLMYFSYQCTLDEQRKAYLYHLVLLHRDEIPDLFEQYRPQIETFVWEQLGKGNISENLAPLYRYFLNDTANIIKAGEQLIGFAFTHLITVKNKEAEKLVVIQDKLQQERTYILEQGRAFIKCYTPEYTLLYEDAAGNRFYNDVEINDKKLLSPEKITMYLEQNGNDSIELLLYRQYVAGAPDAADRSLWPVYQKLALSPEVELGYRLKLSETMMALYYDREMNDELDTLLSEAPKQMTDCKQRSELIRYLIYRDKKEDAYEILFTYGFEGISPKTLARLLGSTINEDSLFDSRMLALTYYTYLQGKYTQDMMYYLCRYFESDLKQMRNVWKAAERFDVDASALVERIIQAALFGHGFIQDMEEVFSYYLKHNKRDTIVRRYINQMSYLYFARQQLPQKCVFETIESYFRNKYELEEICGIAYLHYMAAEVNEYTNEQKEIIAIKVRELLARRQYVPFLGKYSAFLPWLRPYSKLTYIEYRTTPGTRVMLHYLQDGDNANYKQEYLQEVCAGYFSKCFALFFGEKLQYYIVEEREGEENLTQSGMIEKSDAFESYKDSRFSLLNDIMMSESLGDEKTVTQLISEYLRQTFVIETLFS